jgi:hypothetical protein
MNRKPLIFFLALFITGTAFTQITLANKVYESGSKTHFDNYKNCNFYFECDCCSGKIFFINSSNFVFVNYCMSDFVVTKGTYQVSDSKVTLNSDGTRIDVKYNWELEANPVAKPAYFVSDTTIAKYQLNYNIDSCGRTMLISELENGTFIALETDLPINSELEKLKKFKLKELLNLN